MKRRAATSDMIAESRQQRRSTTAGRSRRVRTSRRTPQPNAGRSDAPVSSLSTGVPLSHSSSASSSSSARRVAIRTERARRRCARDSASLAIACAAPAEQRAVFASVSLETLGEWRTHCCSSTRAFREFTPQVRFEITRGALPPASVQRAPLLKRRSL